MVGASDAGAHLDMIDSFSFSTTLLGRAVRERGLLPIEEAMHYLTDAPARLYGLRDRGRLAVGWHADIVVFDPATVGPRRSTRGSTCPAAPAGSTARPTASSTCSSTAPVWSRAAAAGGPAGHAAALGPRHDTVTATAT